MPTQRYERIPLNSPSLEDLTINISYNGGLPNTAPPSFSSIAFDSPNDLPDRNDESAATILPHNERCVDSRRANCEQSDSEGGDGISLWGGTSTSAATSRDSNAARDEAIMLLVKRVEDLEERLDTQQSSKMEKGDIDVEALEIKPRCGRTSDDRRNAIAMSMGALLFLIGFWAFFIFSIRVRRSGAGSS